MEFRGQRECADCGTRWSYFEVGSPACPDCGSLRSEGVGDPAVHTDGNTDLALEEIADAIDDQPLNEAAHLVADRCRTYVNDRGFLSGGELRDLEDEYLSAWELRHLATDLRATARPHPAAEDYFVTLIAATIRADRPGPSAVPRVATWARGLGYAEAVDQYRRDLRRWTSHGAGAAELERLRDLVRAIMAVEGDVEPDHVEELVRTARELTATLRTPDESMAQVRNRLDRLEAQ